MERDEMVQTMLDNISEETGKELPEFVKEIRNSDLRKHTEIRNYFKNTYGLKYGHANTLAHLIREEIDGKSTGQELVDAMFAKKQDLKPIYDKLIEKVSAFGEVEISPKKSYVSLRAKKQFGLLKPSTKTRFDVGLILKGKETSGRLEDGQKWNSMCTHRVSLSSMVEVDDELMNWLKEAFDEAS